jgi:hypothetical protein
VSLEPSNRLLLGQLEIHPEPSAEHEAALLAALAGTADPRDAAVVSAWWRAGIEENLEPDDGD